ncbi:MAG: cellulase family glycosylhydrolase [Fibrobacter sp.]|nr:cellulase family glycosylhydrolase [Fibrobacter sp.]
MAIAKKIAGLLALTSAFAFAGPVSHFGKLVTCGHAYLCGEKTNAAVQVKGPSLYWSTGLGTAFYNETAINWFVNNMNIGVVRAAMAIKYWDGGSDPISMSDGNPGPTTDFGYLSTGSTNKDKQKEMIETVIQAAIDNDIYVIVDWHSHRADQETSEAVAFFSAMATKYKDVPNIIWEVYNEPLQWTAASTINSYASQVAAAIRNAGNNNLIVVGSQKWTSYPLQQSQQGLHNTYQNIAYSFHFYAAEHSLGNGNDAGSAASSNVPMFVTEWGTTAASGDGTPSESGTRTWTQWMDQNKLSSCNWFGGADSQGSAMFKDGTIPSTMSTSNLTSSGNLFKNYMAQQPWTDYVPASQPMGKSIEGVIPDGSSKTFSSELNLRGTISAASSDYGTVTFTDNSITVSLGSATPESFPVSYTVSYGGMTIKERILVKVTNRKPALKDTTISVSYKAPSKFTLLKLGAVDPETGRTNSLILKGASADVGSASISGDTVVYEPAGEGVATVKYQVSNANGTTEGTLILNCENQAPTIYSGSFTSIQNTESAVIDMHLVRGKDADGDSIWFKAYTKGLFPGTINVVAPDTLVYIPEPGKIGTVTMLAVLTDGKLDSKIGPIEITIGGYGVSFDGTIPIPTQIEDYDPSEAVYVFKDPVRANLNVVGTDVLFSLPQSAEVSLAVFDIKGHCVATLAKEKFSAGSHRVGLKGESFPKGMYIARMQYGSQVKSVRFVNK